MKKALSILLAVMLVFSLLAACGGGSDDGADAGNDAGAGAGSDAGAGAGAGSDAGAGAGSDAGADAGDDAGAGSDAGAGNVTAGEAFDNYPYPQIVKADEVKFAYVHGQLTAESQSRSIYHAKLECENRGWEYVDFDNGGDDSKNIDLIANAVNQGCQIILLGNMQNMEAKQPAIAAARNAGCGIYNNDNMIVDGVISNCTMPNGGSAMDLMYYIGEDINWTGKIAVISTDSIQVWIERHEPAEGIINAYPGLELLDFQDAIAGSASSTENSYNIGAAWATKFGEELDGVFAGCDSVGFQVNQAFQADGGVKDSVWISGIDGGNEAWYTIREAAKGNGYFKYSYAQPFELYTHTCFEIMNQVQIEGIAPGSEGSLLSRPGGVFYAEGSVISVSNVPASGGNINSAYDYYTDDQDAWYNWEGTMTIE